MKNRLRQRRMHAAENLEDSLEPEFYFVGGKAFEPCQPVSQGGAGVRHANLLRDWGRPLIELGEQVGNLLAHLPAIDDHVDRAMVE